MRVASYGKRRYTRRDARFAAKHRPVVGGRSPHRLGLGWHRARLGPSVCRGGLSGWVVGYRSAYPLASLTRLVLRRQFRADGRAGDTESSPFPRRWFRILMDLGCSAACRPRGGNLGDALAPGATAERASCQTVRAGARVMGSYEEHQEKRFRSTWRMLEHLEARVHFPWRRKLRHPSCGAPKPNRSALSGSRPRQRTPVQEPRRQVNRSADPSGQGADCGATAGAVRGTCG